MEVDLTATGISLARALSVAVCPFPPYNSTDALSVSVDHQLAGRLSLDTPPLPCISTH